MKQQIQKAFIVVMQLFLTALFVYLLALIASFLPVPRAYQGYLPLFAVAAVVLYLLFERPYQGTLGWNDRHAIRRIGTGFLIGALFISMAFIVMWLAQSLTIQKVQTQSDTLLSVLLYFGLFFIVAFQEEIFVRGYLYGMIRRQYQARIAMISTSLLFALMHLQNPNILSSPIPLLSIFLAGLFLALLRERTESIWLPIGFHWSWNLLQGSFYGFSVSGLAIPSVLVTSPQSPTWLSGGQFGAEGSLITTLLFLAGIWYLWRKKQAQQK